MNNLKIYSDHKELPFYNYSRILQTGDFLYMIKGYESGDDIEADQKELEEKFNVLIQNYASESNSSDYETKNYSQYIISIIEQSKIVLIIGVLENIFKANKLLAQLGVNDDDESLINDLFEGVTIERSPNLEKQIKILYQKKAFHENNAAKYKALMEEEISSEDKSESDIDRMFINVCLGLEISPPDKKNISVHDFFIMTERLVEKIESLEKLNNR